MEAQSNAAKYKSVLKKVRPVNEAIPQDLNPPLERPELARDPYETSFCEEERGILKHSYGKLYKIPVISHEPLQKKPIPIPKSILPQFIGLVRERICTGLYEQSTSSYNSPVFCVEKPNGKLRIVYDLQDLNKVIIKDAGLPPNVDEFVGSFSGRACYGLGDIMGGYDGRELDINTRPLGRLQLTRLPQGATNSVAFYQA
ncbi:hypothetical protein O181_082672 [Austropuccinia psidii MF-1]|uniref:Reverse transcriptase domain-containing protein n=1 Tax=Austropuccinia psidii MF-1 TaxID=1389203 RepID=A0A9Q3FSZ8_9BASI|nr:hypothetical protein [Austropuccinia psidii MF-1]